MGKLAEVAQLVRHASRAVGEGVSPGALLGRGLVDDFFGESLMQ